MPSFQDMPELGWEPEVLAAKAKSAKRNAIVSVVAALVGLIFFGIILGAYAIYSARDAITDINVYNVSTNYKWVARVGQVLGCLSIGLSLLSLILRITGR